MTHPGRLAATAGQQLTEVELGIRRPTVVPRAADGDAYATCVSFPSSVGRPTPRPGRYIPRS